VFAWPFFFLFLCMDPEWEERRKKLADRITATQDELEKRRRERDSKVSELERDRVEIERKKVELMSERGKIKAQLDRNLEVVEAKLAEIERERESLIEKGKQQNAKAAASQKHVVDGLEEELSGAAASDGMNDEFF
jgi:uncharacterized protein (DUF342 family)